MINAFLCHAVSIPEDNDFQTFISDTERDLLVKTPVFCSAPGCGTGCLASPNHAAHLGF